MNIHQVGPDFPQGLQRHRRVVHEGPRLAIRADFAPQNAVRIVIQILGLENILKLVIGNVELPLNHAFALGIEQHPRIGPITQKQAYSAQHNGFTSSRFPRNNIQQWRRTQLQLLNQRVVFNA